jgi:hypothetical protein
MDFEVIDKRAEKRAAEAAAPVAPSALKVVEDQMERATGALASGDLAVANAVAAECQNPPKTYGDLVMKARNTTIKPQKKGQPPPWRSVGYLTAMLPMGQAQILMMRAVGLRESGLLFTADYAIPGMLLDDKENFAAAAKYRLDTFQVCACDRSGRCKFHGEVLPGPGGPGRWLEKDIKRLQDMQKQPMPEAVEILMKAEAARANQRIVVPGRP